MSSKVKKVVTCRFTRSGLLVYVFIKHQINFRSAHRVAFGRLGNDPKAKRFARFYDPDLAIENLEDPEKNNKVPEMDQNEISTESPLEDRLPLYNRYVFFQ